MSWCGATTLERAASHLQPVRPSRPFHPIPLPSAPAANAVPVIPRPVPPGFSESLEPRPGLSKPRVLMLAHHLHRTSIYLRELAIHPPPVLPTSSHSPAGCRHSEEWHGSRPTTATSRNGAPSSPSASLSSPVSPNLRFHVPSSGHRPLVDPMDGHPSPRQTSSSSSPSTFPSISPAGSGTRAMTPSAGPASCPHDSDKVTTLANFPLSSAVSPSTSSPRPSSPTCSCLPSVPLAARRSGMAPSAPMASSPTTS